MCQEHQRQASVGQQPHAQCSHDPDGHRQHPRVPLATPVALDPATIGNPTDDMSAADECGAK